jgi:hypothetical protein
MLTDTEKQHQRFYVAENAIWLYPKVEAILPEVSKVTGYALLAHGSRKRDLDILAMPWIEDCLPINDLIKKLCQRIYRFTNPCQPVFAPDPKPHNRYAYTITLNYGCWIDLSVILPKGHPIPVNNHIDVTGWFDDLYTEHRE